MRLGRSGTGYFPVRYSSIKTPEFSAYLEKNPNAKVSIDQLKYADLPYPQNPGFSEVANTLVMNEIQKCILDPSYTPEKAMQKIFDEAGKLLK